MAQKQTAPRKGSRSRQALLMCMRPQGATSGEILEETGLKSLSHTIGSWLDFYGFEVRGFKLSTEDHKRRGGCYAFKLVGKIIARGKYRSFTIPKGE